MAPRTRYTGGISGFRPISWRSDETTCHLAASWAIAAATAMAATISAANAAKTQPFELIINSARRVLPEPRSTVRGLAPACFAGSITSGYVEAFNNALVGDRQDAYASCLDSADTRVVARHYVQEVPVGAVRSQPIIGRDDPYGRVV